MTWMVLAALMPLVSPVIETPKGDSITIARLQYEGGGIGTLIHRPYRICLRRSVSARGFRWPAGRSTSGPWTRLFGTIRTST